MTLGEVLRLAHRPDEVLEDWERGLACCVQGKAQAGGLVQLPPMATRWQLCHMRPGAQAPRREADGLAGAAKVQARPGLWASAPESWGPSCAGSPESQTQKGLAVFRIRANTLLARSVNSQVVGIWREASAIRNHQSWSPGKMRRLEQAKL